MFRKFCSSCKAPLVSKSERLTGVCKECALLAHKGFEEMGKGNFKAGLKQVIDVKFCRNDSDTRKELIEAKLLKAVAKKEKIIRRKLKKKGLSDVEIEEGLKKFRGGEDE